MAVQTVKICLGRLLCPDLTASTKLVWLALQLDRHLQRHKLLSPTRIERRVGVSRPTIRRSYVSLDSPWKPQVPDHLTRLTRTQVRVRADLITDKSVPAMARVIYCVLMGLQELRKLKSHSSYASIAKVLQVQARTVRRAVQALAIAGWLTVKQANIWSPLDISFTNPKAARERAAVRRAEQRLKKSEAFGETLALLWCDTLVDSTNYQDDCYPDFFVNPRTGELLQADRYYVDHQVVIEFNGPQHDGPTLRFSEAEAKSQMARDRVKEEICKRHKIPFITLRPEDLTFQRLRDVLGKVLPLRSIRGDEPIINFLQSKSRKYIRSIKSIRRSSGQPT